MMKQLTCVLTAIALVALMSSAEAAPKVDWQTVKTASGTIRKSESRNYNRQLPRNGKLPPAYLSVTIYKVSHDFSVETPGWRISWDCEETDKSGNVRMYLYKLDKRGSRESWRKAGTIGRTNGSGKGERIYVLGPGEYRIELQGSAMKYTVTVDEAHRPSKDDNSVDSAE